MTAIDAERPNPGTSTNRDAAFVARSSHAYRFERDGIVYTANGRIGLLRQVVVDDRIGEISSLVVELDKTGERILVPPQGVERTRGSAIFLRTSRDQFNAWLETAPRASGLPIVKANVKSLLKAGMENVRNPRVVVQGAGKNFVETGK